MISNLGMGFDPQRMASQVVPVDTSLSDAQAQARSALASFQSFWEPLMASGAVVSPSASAYAAAQQNVYNAPLAGWQPNVAGIARQQAYNQQQTGGGFTGGLLNDTYAQPFAGTVTGSNNGFQSGMMGQPGWGGQPSSWGGPFNNANPWSLGG